MKHYQRGEPITSLDELMAQTFVFWNDKIAPNGWFQNWQLHMAHEAIKHGTIAHAVRVEERHD